MIEREFVSLVPASGRRAGAGGRPCQGLYHRPFGQQPATAVIATHYEVDFAEHYLADFMAERGIGFLGWNTRFRGAGAYFSLAAALGDITAGVDWLRHEAGVDRVIVLGNSGGASLMGAWQAKAEHPGELFVSLCAHPGRPDVLTMWLDPSVTDENDPISRDPSLDMFEQPPPYDPEFVARYRAAQTARNEKITAWCKAELDRLTFGRAWDRGFPVFRTWADLRFLDLTLDPSERSAGCYAGDPRTANYGPFGLAALNTCRSWLSMWSLSESECRIQPHLGRVTVPSLVVQSTGDQGCFPSDAQAIYDALGSADKTLEWVPGDHYLETPASGRDDLADLITGWVGQKS